MQTVDSPVNGDTEEHRFEVETANGIGSWEQCHHEATAAGHWQWTAEKWTTQREPLSGQWTGKQANHRYDSGWAIDWLALSMTCQVRVNRSDSKRRSIYYWTNWDWFPVENEGAKSNKIKHVWTRRALTGSSAGAKSRFSAHRDVFHACRLCNGRQIARERERERESGQVKIIESEVPIQRGNQPDTGCPNDTSTSAVGLVGEQGGFKRAHRWAKTVHGSCL